MSRILILWNASEDVVEHWRRDDRRAPDWDPSKQIEPWDTVAEEMELLASALRGGGHDPVIANIADDFSTLHEILVREKPDAILNLVEWFHDDVENETFIPALFELMNLSYTGNRPLALSLCQKKPHAKALLVANGLPTPRGVTIDGPVPADFALKFPVIVKPAYDDASAGVDATSVVHDRAALEKRVARLQAEGKGVALVEEYIEGREIHCAILGNDPPEALPLYEMEFKGGLDDDGAPLPNIITYRAKWDPYSRDYHALGSSCPPRDLSPELSAKMKDIAMRAFKALGCRDYARVDMRLDRAGNPYILEVNPNPDLADGCAFAASVRASGRTYAQAIVEIVEMSLKRARSKAPVSSGEPELLLREYLARKA